MRTKNNIDKSLSDAPKVKDAIKLASERDGSEFELQLMDELSGFEEWKKQNPDKTIDDYYEFLGVGPKKVTELKLNLSRKNLLNMLAKENPKVYVNMKPSTLRSMSTVEIKQMLDNLDREGLPFAIGGLVSNYKIGARKP